MSEKHTWEVKIKESSNISCIGYDTENLFVGFKSGGFYRYDKVNPELVNDFLKAESKGKFFANYILGKYTTTKIHMDDKIAGIPSIIKPEGTDAGK